MFCVTLTFRLIYAFKYIPGAVTAYIENKTPELKANARLRFVTPIYYTFGDRQNFEVMN